MESLGHQATKLAIYTIKMQRLLSFFVASLTYIAHSEPGRNQMHQILTCAKVLPSDVCTVNCTLFFICVELNVCTNFLWLEFPSLLTTILKGKKLKSNAVKVPHPKYSGPKIGHQSNLTPIMYKLRVLTWSRNSKTVDS